MHGHLGISTRFPELCLVLEFCPLGDLQHYLVPIVDAFEDSGNNDTSQKSQTNNDGFLKASIDNSNDRTSSVSVPVLDEEMLFRICIDITEGMCYLHERHIVHKDLKPDNIMLFSLDPTADIVAKLTDFGTSKVRTTESFLI